MSNEQSCFNIYSPGNTASTSITDFLNNHGAICFHAMRVDPFLHPDLEGGSTGKIEELGPEIIFPSLLVLQDRMHSK